MKMCSWLHACAVALLVVPAFGSPGQPQTFASPDVVPKGLSAPEWFNIRQQYEQQRHAAFPVADGYQARNPGQQWQTRFDGRGFTTKPDGAAWQWGLELQSYGFPGHERTVAGQPRVKTSGQRVTYDWDVTLQEWFVNDRKGLEHGFTVRERPPALECADWSASEGAFSARLPSMGSSLVIFDGDKSPAESGDESPHSKTPLTFTLAVRGGLRPEVQADGRSVRFVDAQGAAALTYSELTVLDADGRKLPAHFEPVERSRRREKADSVAEADSSVIEPIRLVTSAATEESLRLVIDERGARYPLTIDPIAQQAYLKASNTGANDWFGHSVAVSGDTVVVGAQQEGSSGTGVNGDQSNNNAPGSGAAYIFVRNGTNWIQQAFLKASNAEEGDSFGWSVAVSGDTVVVGAQFESSGAAGVNGNQANNSAQYAGAAYIFVRNGNTWTQQAYLKASNPGVRDGFGNSVAVSGDTVVVASGGESSNATGVNGNQANNSAQYAGAAYVFVRNGTTWTQQAYLKASNTGALDNFGLAVAASGDTIVIGAPGEASNASGVNGDQSDNSADDSGAVYVFVRSGTIWTQQAYLKASNPGTVDWFGQSVAVSGDTVVVGAPQESSNAIGVNGDQNNNSASTSGAAYIFVRHGTNWTQQTYLKASNAEADQGFGTSVAVSGYTVVVGSGGESSNATGVNGNQSNNNAPGSGAAYVFVRNGTTWTQQAYLKASSTGAGDSFGTSVAVSGDTVITGAWREASQATGVDGDQDDNSADASGAAYIFADLSMVTPPAVVLALDRDGSNGYFLHITGVPNVTYQLQRARSVTGPWSDLVTKTASAVGLIEYHETSPPPGAAFYRTALP